MWHDISLTPANGAKGTISRNQTYSTGVGVGAGVVFIRIRVVKRDEHTYLLLSETLNYDIEFSPLNYSSCWWKELNHLFFLANLSLDKVSSSLLLKIKRHQQG